jgi:hypothetical protein
MKKEKIIKNLKNDMLTLAIVEAIIVLYYIVSGTVPVLNIIVLGALIGGYVGARKKEKYASYIGIVTGTLMITAIFFLDILDCVLGIFVLIDSIKYLKAVK